MNPTFSKSDERIIYYVVTASVVAGLLFYAILAHFGFRLVGTVPKCIFYRLTGFYCPGCGGTHALDALLHGRLAQAFLYHPLVAYVAVLLGVFIVTQTVEILSRGKLAVGMCFREMYLYLMLVIIVGNWIVRNILLHAFGIPIY